MFARESLNFWMPHPMRAVLSMLVLIAGLVAGGATHVRAQGTEEAAGGSFITPFPEGDVYKLQVFGDWWASGLLEGLVEALGGDQRLQIQRKHRMIQGVNRNEFDEDLRALEESISKETIHIAVVMLGQADRTSVRVPGQGRRAAVGSEEWRAEYARRLDRLIRVLKKRNTAIYWVGLPSLRRSDAHEDAQLMNELIRERASLNGMRYVDAFGGFASEAGAYDNYGPDITGKIRVLRDPDGVGFTPVGYRKLAHFVERELLRDLTQAQAERSIPLAGSESEQARLNPAKAHAAAPPAAGAGAPKGTPTTTGWQGTVSGAKSAPGALPAAPAVASQPAAMGGFAEQKADHGKIVLKQVGASGREETVTLEILRPALASTVIAAVTRRETADKPSQMGDSIGDDLPGGLTVLSSITPASESATGPRRRVAASQTPYFRVLVKGERMSPKPGRADEHGWPRPEHALVPAQGETQVQTPPQAAGEDQSGRTPTPAARRGRDARDRQPASGRRAPADDVPAKAPKG